VSKPAAKKIIFDLLFDAFRPMNITEINKVSFSDRFTILRWTCNQHHVAHFDVLLQGLKAVVPSPVLSACLQDMALDKHDDKNPFADSDDEEELKEDTTTTEPYAGSLLFKPGRNQASNLYYVDHTKLKGMDREQREALAQNTANATAEEGALKDTLKTTLGKAAQLLSEPTNEEATLRHETEEAAMKDLDENLETARKLKVNENHKQKTKKRIQNMAAQWRARKRLCVDFLISLEENTDGAVTVKKCLANDGQICLDSDDSVAKAAVKFAKDKRSRNIKGGLKGRKKGGTMSRGLSKGSLSSESDSLADESFVAVKLDSQNSVCRVHVDEQE
jgi:hypothetical protein